jgi:hypothetical protein
MMFAFVIPPFFDLEAGRANKMQDQISLILHEKLAFSDSYAGIIRIRFQGLGIHVYLVSAGPYPAPLFTCEFNLALSVPFVKLI